MQPEDSCNQLASPTATDSFQMHRSRKQYLADIQACKDALYRGDSYEICLTNKLTASMSATDAWKFYQTLRKVNAAPYAAWMHCGAVRVQLDKCHCPL